MELLKKLNCNEQQEICIVNAPVSFRDEIEKMYKEIRFLSPEDMGFERQWVLVFVQDAEDIEKYADSILLHMAESAPVWIAYPRRSDEITLESGWEAMSEYNYGIVRQTILDEKWAALCFRLQKPHKSAGRAKKEDATMQKKKPRRKPE